MRLTRNIAVAARAIGALHPPRLLGDPSRQFNCQNQDQQTWDERAEAAVDLLRAFLNENGRPGRTRIGDLGCGNQRLGRILRTRLQLPYDYVGYDLHPQSEDIARLDVEKEMPDKTFDVAFCLGLLEYLRDVGLFARRLHETCGVAVVSYVIAGEGSGPPCRGRRRLGWRTDYMREDLEQIFEAAGFQRRAFEAVLDGSTGLWLWRATKVPAR